MHLEVRLGGFGDLGGLGGVGGKVLVCETWTEVRFVVVSAERSEGQQVHSYIPVLALR